MKQYDRYIEKCFKDAAQNNERKLTSTDYAFRYYIFNKKKIAIVLDCRYGRVLKQASRRIKNNFQKNFGLELTTVLEYDANQQGFDPNYCVCEAIVTTMNGKEKHIWVSHTRNEDLELVNAPYCLMLELAKKKGIINPESNEDDEFTKKVSWEKLKELWMEVYHETKFKNLDITTSDNVRVLG